MGPGVMFPPRSRLRRPDRTVEATRLVMLRPTARKLVLTGHLTFSVGWVGAAFAYLALGVAAVNSQSTRTVRAAWTAMEITGWYVVVPLALGSLLSGLVMGLGSRLGLFRHYWVLISLAVTFFCTVVLVLHMSDVSLLADAAQDLEGPELRGLGGDLGHPAIGIALLLGVQALNVYKPKGLTPYGWRKQQRQHPKPDIARGAGLP